MNPRRVHELMRKHFPAFDAAKVEWTIVSRSGPDAVLVASFLDRYISVSDVLIEAYRPVGDYLPKAKAVEIICKHMGKTQILIADRSFTSFVVVAQPGVATGWNAGGMTANCSSSGRKSA
jgi:hypothetical protein